MPEALKPSEMRSAVFKHLVDNSGTLVAAARVCRSRYMPAVDVLWRSLLAWELGAVKGDERHQFYSRASYAPTSLPLPC
jgi:hypothetical protein